jgi:motility quorum-sensing regulator / GCU-specific mRNA interferase toxin
MIEANKVRSTMSALASGAALGFDFAGIIGVIKALTSADFHKSMTTHADHRILQDVDRPIPFADEVYLKLAVIDMCSSYLSRSYEYEMSRLRSGKTGA